MTISSLKELEKLVRSCRKLGVESITIDGISLKLGDEPQARLVKSAVKTTRVATTIEDIDTPDEPTEEQLMYYSSGAV